MQPMETTPSSSSSATGATARSSSTAGGAAAAAAAAGGRARATSTFNYVVTAQKPTSVGHSLVGSFTGEKDLNLVVSKCNRIGIHVLTPEGLHPLLDVPIYGRIACLDFFRVPGEKQDVLFVLTERYKFCVLSYNAATGEIVTRANGDVQDRVGRPVEVGQIGLVDPDVRMIGLHLYDGLFKVIPFDPKGQLRDAFNIRMEEIRVLDIKFLHGMPRPVIVVLFEDTKNARHVKTYEVRLDQKDLQDGPWALSNVEPSASLLLAVPRPIGGVLIVGEQSITYHGNAPTHVKTIAMRATQMKCAGRIDADGSRWLLGDHLGSLFVLLLMHDAGKLRDMRLELLGQTSIASTLSYLDNRYVFVGSHFGDSQLVRLRAEKDDSGTFTDIVETFTNLGPIVDFAVVDLERQGQGQVVTCSGAFKDGSLRIIRNGVGINEQATIELNGVKGLWSLRSSSGSEFDRFLAVSFIHETRFLAIQGEELEEADIAGFDSKTSTLICGNVLHNGSVQVTPQSVRLIDAGTLQLRSEWRPEGGALVTVTSSNEQQIVVAVGGRTLVYLEITADKIQLVAQRTLEHEIACLSIRPLGDAARASIVAVGLWTEISVRLFAVPSLQPLTTERLGGEIIPRSLLFVTFENVHYLLCALGDGHLYNFNVDATNGSLTNRKKVSLGTQPIVLSAFRSKNALNVFACSDRPTVIYSSNKRLLYSTVNLKEVGQMCTFHTENFRDCLAIATENALAIGTIDEIQKLHIRTVPLGEMPRRIAYCEAARSFALLTVRHSFEATGDVTESGFVRLIDDQTFEVMHSFALAKDEMAQSVIAVSLTDADAAASTISTAAAGGAIGGSVSPVSIGSSSTSAWYFVVGTAFVLPGETEPSKGRLLLFAVQDRKLLLLAERDVRGCVYSLAPFNGLLVASVNSKVQVFRLAPTEDGGKELQPACNPHHGNILALFLATRGDFIVVGDMMKSISLLAYKPAERAIEEIARDYNPNWMTAVEILDDDTYIGAENGFNLFSVRKNVDAATDEERGKLETVGEFHLGDFVNRFRHGSLVMRMAESEGYNIPTLLFGTVSGSIGVVASLPQELFAFFLRLQKHITTVIKGVGGFRHDQWRSFCNERKTVDAHNFIDGDLVEAFLELGADKQSAVARHMEMSVEDLCKKIETLTQAVH